MDFKKFAVVDRKYEVVHIFHEWNVKNYPIFTEKGLITIKNYTKRYTLCSKKIRKENIVASTIGYKKCKICFGKKEKILRSLKIALKILGGKTYNEVGLELNKSASRIGQISRYGICVALHKNKEISWEDKISELRKNKTLRKIILKKLSELR